MKENDLIEELEKFKHFANLVGSPDEYFEHMQHHDAELSLILNTFELAEKADMIIDMIKLNILNNWVLTEDRLPEQKDLDVTEKDFNNNYCFICKLKIDDETIVTMLNYNPVNKQWVADIPISLKEYVVAWRPLLKA